MPGGQVVRTVYPEAVLLAGMNPGQVGVPDVPVDLDQLQSGLLTLIVDQT
jgi:hypothetical protein